ncbi:hypothetical protein QBC37DRAFT_166766 [Rhypophila decipiens]|uniref:ER membrane protein complex subunit 1 n=1 Tax=Rhypophila decipiens TaxID=261697 RepID=A0AAN7BCL2_9PEZI|nr:hypothetical protein QBC37DRAFT_166766 [Rhypophila decipiens]
MLPPQLSTFLLLALPSAVRAVFQDEVGHIDYHYELLGVPQPETTFFHRPRREERASLLYTLSDIGVLGAVNPTSGAVVWRHLLNGTLTNGGGFLRAGEGENWVTGALGKSVHAWDGVNGRNKFWVDFDGEVKDLEIMEMTENNRKDVLALFDEHGSTVLRRLSGDDGAEVWKYTEASKDIPLQVSTNVEKVFVISLRGSSGSYNLKVTVIDTLTGKELDQWVLGAKGEVRSEKDVMFVGANSAAPIVAWTDDSLQKLRISVLGTRNRQEFALPEDTLAVEIHAPHLVQSLPHFLVHIKTAAGNFAQVYHTDLKTNAISKAYDLPNLEESSAFSTSSDNANVYFSRITDGELVLVSSVSSAIVGQWPLKDGKLNQAALHAVSDVVKKSGSGQNFAIRAAVVTDKDNWVLVRNGELAWTRPEGMSGGVAAAFAEIPENEDLAKTLEQEAHENPLEAYIHRVNRHIHDLQYLPAYLSSIPSRLMDSILGTETSTKDGKPARDSFGFHKLAILATRRGMLYGLDIGNHGRILWADRVFHIAGGDKWNVTGIQINESGGETTVVGSNKDSVTFKTLTGEIVESKAPEIQVSTQSTALVSTEQGQILLPIGSNGEVLDVPSSWTPGQTVVTQGSEGGLKGITFVDDGSKLSQVVSWTFALPEGQKVASIATRPVHDPVASIGRVLGDRSVRYKYLNPNTLVLAAIDESKSTLTVYLLDTVSGQILTSSTYEGVDAGKPIEVAMSENWFVVSFFGQNTLRSSPDQSIKGYQIAITDLYESDVANDRGPLEDAENFSSLEPLDVPSAGGTSALPAVISQTYVLSSPIKALQVSQTRQGISSRQVLAYLPEMHGIVGIPRMFLEPRRPVGRDPTPAEVEEGLMKYHPVIEIDPKSIVTHERDVLGVEKIITSPAVVESTSLVFAFGVDVFGTRVAPSFLFDILGKGFNKLSLVGTVMACFAGVVALGPMVRRKQIDARWKAPM